MAIIGNRLRGGFGTLAAAYKNDAPGSADYEVEATWFRISGSSAGAEMRIRWDGSTAYYYVTWFESTGVWRLRSEGPFGTISGASDSADADFKSGAAPSRKVTLRVQGTTLTLLIDGVVVTSGTDSNHSAAGVAGVALQSTPTNGIHIDDFVVRDIAA